MIRIGDSHPLFFDVEIGPVGPVQLDGLDRHFHWVPKANEQCLRLLAIRHFDLRSEAVVGRVTDSNSGKVIMKTLIGGKRLLDMPSGEMLPRIC